MNHGWHGLHGFKRAAFNLFWRSFPALAAPLLSDFGPKTVRGISGYLAVFGLRSLGKKEKKTIHVGVVRNGDSIMECHYPNVPQTAPKPLKSPPSTRSPRRTARRRMN